MSSVVPHPPSLAAPITTHPTKREHVRSKKVIQTAVGAAVIIGSLAVGVGYAQADYAPSSTDVVGFGGDTPQQPINFGADGDVSGDLGYNAANNPNKLVSID